MGNKLPQNHKHVCWQHKFCWVSWSNSRSKTDTWQDCKAFWRNLAFNVLMGGFFFDMASCKEWWLADSMKGAGALAGWEGQGGEEERGQLGLSIFPYVRAVPFANSKPGHAKQKHKVPRFICWLFWKSWNFVLWRGGENGDSLSFVPGIHSSTSTKIPLRKNAM